MKYIQVTITVSEGTVEEAVGKLFSLGLDQVEIMDEQIGFSMEAESASKNPDRTQLDSPQPGTGRPPQIRLYFQKDQEQKKKLYDVFSHKDLEETLVDDKEWKYKYKEDCRVVPLTSQVRVVPSWEREKEKIMEKDIFLDPGMAFGTGHHETTLMCSKLLARKLSPGETLLDIGTGSGILAILGQRLGASKVIGIDIDSDAVKVARENVALNKAQQVVTIQQGDLTQGLNPEEEKAHVVVANLIAEVVVSLGEQIGKYIQKDGYFIASGILREKEEMVVRALRDFGFQLEEVRRKGDWCAICGKYA